TRAFLPADHREAQKVEGLRFALTTLLSIECCIAPKPNEPCLFRMQRERECLRPLPHLHQKPLGIRLVFEAEDSIISKAHDDHAPWAWRFRHCCAQRSNT